MRRSEGSANAHPSPIVHDFPIGHVVGIAIEVVRVGRALAVGAPVGALLAAIVRIGARAIALEAGERVLDDKAADVVVALGKRRSRAQQRQDQAEADLHANSRSWRVSSPSASRSSWTMVKWSAPATGISGPGRCSADRRACRSRLSATSGGSSAVP